MFKEIRLYNASEYIDLHHNYIGIGVETTNVYNIKTFASDMSRLEVLFEYPGNSREIKGMVDGLVNFFFIYSI